MEAYIPASLLNDFAYCPESIYLHMVYQDFAEYIYKDIPQANGTLNHKTIDTNTYSSSKHILQGLSFYCEKYCICGKIDTFNTKTGVLVERKSRLKTVHPGYRFQLYAQMFGLQEMGFTVNKLFFHSLEDNKRYAIQKPTLEELEEFEACVSAIRNFNPLTILENRHSSHNSTISIYNNLTF